MSRRISMATKTQQTANSSAAIAMAFAGRTARACDVCGHKSAHWFCAADDAHLCTACDKHVHSANALSRRHERVRLTPNGTAKTCKIKEESHTLKRSSPSASLLPSRKRSRTTRPYSHHLRRLTHQVTDHFVKVEEEKSFPVKAELELFDFLEGDEFLNDAGNQEVPEFDLLSSDHSQEGDHSPSADSFATFCFKGKAAHSTQVDGNESDDQFLVPDGLEFLVADAEVQDVVSSDAGSVESEEDLSGEAFFFPGDIPGLDRFESFVPEMDLSDDFSLSFDLALQNHNHNNSNGSSLDAFEGDTGATGVASAVAQVPDHFTTGPFAKFFAKKSKLELVESIDTERIKLVAREMLKCCQEGEDEARRVPSLKLNLTDVITAWSDRGEPWIDFKPLHEDSTSSGGNDVALVPDMEDNQSGDRDARVLRYKEKRRTRLFSKKIRYEVRKLNAERRPRMKGRFVKRVNADTVPAVS